MTARLREHAVTLVLVVALVALVVVLGARFLGRDHADRAPVLVAARQAATTFFGLDHRTVSKDVARMVRLSTGDFKREYSSRQAKIVADVEAQQIVAKPTVPDDGAAVEYLTDRRARVLVSVDLERSAKGGEAVRQQYRAQVRLARVDGRWLVSDIKQVG